MTKTNAQHQLSGATHGERAFTLIEVLIVVLIAGILAATVVPAMLSADSVQIVAAGRMLASDMQYAQTEAISTQTPVTVSFDPAGETYSLSNASGTLINPITGNSYIVVFSANSSLNDVDLVSADFDGAAFVIFDEMGAPDASGSVTLQAGPHSLRVNVANATGTVTVVEVGW